MAFLGMRGTGDWGTDVRPKNFRQGILYLYPNGDTPLTGMLSMMDEKSIDDPEFAWWTEALAAQGGVVTGVFTNTGLSTAYVSGGVTGQVLYFKMAQAAAEEFRKGHQVLLRDSDKPDVDVNGKVLEVMRNGANSFLAVRLLEPDDNGATTDLSDCDWAQINGSVNPEGGPMPDPVSYDPTKVFNYTQIFRDSLSITGTAMETFLRTEDEYKKKKRQTLQYHSIQMERAFMWGQRFEGIGENGKPERTTMGLINFIRTYAPTNVSNYPTNAAYTGKTWLAPDGGEHWLDTQLELLFRFGSSEKMAFAGSGAILGLNRLAKTAGRINLEPKSVAYGLQVMQWITPFGTVYLKIHPLFSYDVATRNSIVLFEPSRLTYVYMRNRDTKFFPDDGKHGATRIDGINEEYLTECGLMMEHPITSMYLTGVGLNNP
jgi:Family of unknown function (DUF5309)